MEPLVSVVVPVYNIKKYLNRCIDSIIVQDYKKLQIIIVDDGSTDGSEEICDNYKNKDNRITVIHQKNGGLSKARNIGIEIATGEYITFIDSDDFVHPCYISFLVKEKLESKSQLVQCSMKSVFGDECKNDLGFSGERKIISGKEAILSYDYMVSACAKLFDKSLFDDVRYPEGLVYEDEATYYKLAFKCDTVCLTTAELYYYYQSPNSITRNNNINLDFIPVCKERIEFFKNKNDSDLLDNAYERYAVTLMLKYVRCVKIKAEADIKKQLIELYKDNYRFLNKKSINVKFRILLILYRYFPNIIATVIGAFRRNK